MRKIRGWAEGALKEWEWKKMLFLIGKENKRRAEVCLLTASAVAGFSSSPLPRHHHKRS